MSIRTFAPLLGVLALSTTFALPASVSARTKKAVAPEVTEALRGLEVRAKLVDRLGLDAVRIGVSVTGKRATLTGDVPKKVTQELAKEVALSVRGIDEVDNQVKEITPAGPMVNAKSEAKDAGLEIRVKTRLLEEIGTNALDITVESTDGVVSLRGKMSNGDVSKAAAKRVERMKGVKKVVNLLTV
jgi:osmotically-inducible protein OsmY